MNFFEHQERARRRTGLLAALFALATGATVVLANAVVLFAVALLLDDREALTASQWIARHPAPVVWTTLITLGFIGAASMYRMASLGRGGSALAQSLGGVRVDGNTNDPLRRQLVNVVEEMAIAAGVPVPAVYVLEEEPGINAFAAGFTPSDAAIAVTRGTLETLTRDELQGVIAHEFSHIFNGDMRLNMRLVGVLFGIVVIGYTGRLILRHLPRVRSRKAGQAMAAIFIASLALIIIGYLGMLFGSMIRAAVSRQREFLADASAVQFTRNPGGIAGALKKIAAAPLRSVLQTHDADEVGHMLIADGRKMFASFFATHPPIVERIRAIDHRFDSAELEKIRLKPVASTPSSKASSTGVLLPAMVIAAIGNPNESQAMLAAERHNGIPEALQRAARSRTHAPGLVLALALNKNDGERKRQIERLRARLPEALVAHLEAFVTMVVTLTPVHRLPLIEMALPALRDRPPAELETMVGAIEEITRMDGSFDVLDYALVRVLRVYLTDAAEPLAAGGGNAKLHRLRNDAAVLFAVLSHVGDSDPRLAQSAYHRGMRQLFGGDVPAYAPPSPWVVPLDRALARLDALAPMGKQALIEALTSTIAHDKRFTLGEAELMRAIGASLHCPIPPLPVNSDVAGTSAPHVAA